jgi:hypothetical protein
MFSAPAKSVSTGDQTEFGHRLFEHKLTCRIESTELFQLLVAHSGIRMNFHITEEIYLYTYSYSDICLPSAEMAQYET